MNQSLKKKLLKETVISPFNFNNINRANLLDWLLEISKIYGQKLKTIIRASFIFDNSM